MNWKHHVDARVEHRTDQQKWLDEVNAVAEFLRLVKGYSQSYALAVAKAEVPFPRLDLGEVES